MVSNLIELFDSGKDVLVAVMNVTGEEKVVSFIEGINLLKTEGKISP